MTMDDGKVEEDEMASNFCSHRNDGEQRTRITYNPTMKGVRFRENETLCSYHEGAVIDLDECVALTDIWYEYQELCNMKRKAMIVAKEAQKYGFGSLLSKTYGKLCDETQIAVNTWARNGNSRRGLERWINNEYAAKRADIRRRTIQSVLRAQEKMREEGINDVDYGTKVLARLSEAFSIDSRHFAVVMGRADEAAVNETDLSDEESLSVEKGKHSKPGSSASTQQARRPQVNRMHIARNPRTTQRRPLGLSSTGNEFRHFF